MRLIPETANHSFSQPLTSINISQKQLHLVGGLISTLTHHRLVLRLACILIAACCIVISLKTQADNAKALFQAYQKYIFQIRVIELASGNKSTIGSGFLISNDGHIATNYHVISLYIQKPERYRLEYIAHDHSTGSLSALDLDVVHDIAIIKAEFSSKNHFTLDNTPLSKGTRIYSMGNPHDLGMSIIEGTYNGLLEQTLYDKIFFSGSLNPGMSGGPAINENGRVIGVNVSTAGNQLSFLVPINYLIDLKSKLDPNQPVTDFNSRIEQQLVIHQQYYLDKILSMDWPRQEFGAANLPGKIADIFKCWGDSDNDEEALVDHSFSQCMSEDRLFLASNYTTGGISYTYDLYTKKDIGALHFYNIYSKQFGRPIRVNNARKEDVTNYECATNFTTVAGKDWKMAYCARNHSKFKSLFDITLSMALVSDYNQGLIVQLAISGITQPMASQFVDRFLGEIKWQN